MCLRTSSTRYVISALFVAALALTLAGCGTTTQDAATAASTPVATLTTTATATAVRQVKVAPSATPPTVVTRNEFTCPATADGSDKAIADASLLLTVAYPSSWSETHCTRTKLSDGSVTLWIGNYVHIDAVLDTNTTVQQYVNAHQSSFENVTLQPVTVRQAMEAFDLNDQLDQSAPSPADYYFSQVHAILRGSRFLYLLTTSQGLDYADTASDTPPPGPIANYISDWEVS